MTITARIAVSGDITPDELYALVRPLVRTPVGAAVEREDGVIRTECGVGADAWVIVRYANSGEALFVEWYEQSDPLATQGGSVATVSMDTATSYRAKVGRGKWENVDQLHARIVGELCAALDDRGVGFAIEDERTGQWTVGRAPAQIS